MMTGKTSLDVLTTVLSVTGILLLIVSPSCVAYAAVACPSAGCPVASAMPVVCGADGNTYMSECLAVCQGVQVVSRGQCAGAKISFKQQINGSSAAATAARASTPNPATAAHGAKITLAAMNKFKKEGFKLLGAAAVSTAKHDNNNAFKMPIYTLEQVAKMKAEAGASPFQHSAQRLDLTTGLLYAQSAISRTSSAGKLSKTDSSTSSRPKRTPGYHPRNAAAAKKNTAKTAGRRKLSAIFGSDGRREIFPLSEGYPNTVVGQLASKSGTCSATLIDKNTILTAAHCVYDTKLKVWDRGLTFYPARGRRSRGSSSYSNPYGGVRVLTMSTYAGYIRTGRSEYDVAIGQLASNIGNSVSWMGMWYGSIIGTAYSAGYPGEKAYGTQWESSCSISDTNDGDALTKTTGCDITAGNSGGPMYQFLENTAGDTDAYVMAVCSHTVCNYGFCNGKKTCCRGSGYNGFVQFDSGTYDDLTGWAEANG